MTKRLLTITFAVILFAPVALFAADPTPPPGFPIDEVVFGLVLGVLGLLVPWLLGKTKFKEWKREWKTLVGYLISAAVAGIALIIARLTTGAWPFGPDWWAAITIGWSWVQFAYSMFVKGWIEKADAGPVTTAFKKK